jgi:hypothetical protein
MFLNAAWCRSKISCLRCILEGVVFLLAKVSLAQFSPPRLGQPDPRRNRASFAKELASKEANLSLPLRVLKGQMGFVKTRVLDFDVSG